MLDMVKCIKHYKKNINCVEKFPADTISCEVVANFMADIAAPQAAVNRLKNFKNIVCDRKMCH